MVCPTSAAHLGCRVRADLRCAPRPLGVFRRSRPEDLRLLCAPSAALFAAGGTPPVGRSRWYGGALKPGRRKFFRGSCRYCHTIRAVPHGLERGHTRLVLPSVRRRGRAARSGPGYGPGAAAGKTYIAVSAGPTDIQVKRLAPPSAELSPGSAHAGYACNLRATLSSWD
jgi:hypothetical protein